MSPRPDPQADPQARPARRPARQIPPFVWILIVVVIVGFIALRLQQGARLQQQAAPAAAGAGKGG